MTTTDPWSTIGDRLGEVLGRPDLAVDRASLGKHLSGKRVLITGAGGSIGSALAGVLASVAPADLTLLDLHENSLFQLRQRLQVTHPGAPLRYVLADVRNQKRIGRVLDEAAPEVIFHLAAYKHVPLAEELAAEFAGVNVLGTWRLLQEARRHGVERFIYPSTDKAVNPPSVYGATKRAAEILLRTEAMTEAAPRITIVRLVNVLGAWGGVIETFVRQISAGLPVTITDPRMTRYWITLDEALLLLTTAAAPTGHGNILLLDLGAPVSVATVAERLWAILRPRAKALAPVLIGSRPGERLAEELCYADEHLAVTDYRRVLKVERRQAARCSAEALVSWLRAIEVLVEDSADPALRDALFRFVANGE